MAYGPKEVVGFIESTLHFFFGSTGVKVNLSSIICVLDGIGKTTFDIAYSIGNIADIKI